MATSDLLITPREVAALLRCDREKVYTLVAEGWLGSRRVGKRYIISRAAVMRWLVEGVVDAPPATAPPRVRRRTRPIGERSAR